MTVFKCKMCGGELNVQNSSSICECEYCGTKQTVPNINDEKITNLYDRGNQLARDCRFDDAIVKYESILDYESNDPDIYWCILLCKYGINYVKDPYSGKMMPSIHRYQDQSIFSNTEYEKIMEISSIEQAQYYKNEAEIIDKIHKKFNAIVNTEDPYDVFICYKQTDDITRRDTEDYKIAYELYNELTKEGLKVFFSHVSLESKIGEEYEPYIYAALKSSKIMLAIGTKKEYYDAIWVKNEWRRFMYMLNEEKKLIPVCSDASVLPNEFSRYQCVQINNNIVWKEDLVRQINKIINNYLISNSENKIKKYAKTDNSKKNIKIVKPAESSEKKKNNKLKLLLPIAIIIILIVGALFLFNTRDDEGNASISNTGENRIVSGSAKGFDSNENVTVNLIIENNEIVDVEIEEDEGAFGKKALPRLKANVLRSNGNSIDMVAGATITSTAVKEAFENALNADKANGNIISFSSSTYDISESVLMSEINLSNAKIVSQDGDTFVVESRFFEGTNKFTIVKENGAIKSLEFTEFDDTPGIGDAAMHKGFIKSFEGATLDSEIDCVAGATYTSKSAIAAAKIVLQS